MKEKLNTKQVIERILFDGSKWMLIPFYMGLMVALGIYCVVTLKEVWSFVHNFVKSIIGNEVFTHEEAMLVVLLIVDMTMIANLIKMIITGSYNSFVSKKHHDNSEKSSSGLLKVKMATSLVGVSSIHLLKSFVNPESQGDEILTRQLLIHGSFLIGALILAIIDYFHAKSEAIHPNDAHTNPNNSNNTNSNTH